MNDTTTTTTPEEPSLGVALGLMLGKILGELERMSFDLDGARHGEGRNAVAEILQPLSNRRIEAGILAAELGRVLQASPELLAEIEETLTAELDRRLDEEPPTLRLEDGDA